MGVARASLEEFLGDYRDALRVRGMRAWDKESREARYVNRFRDRGAEPEFGGLEAIPRRHMTDTATLAILAPLK